MTVLPVLKKFSETSDFFSKKKLVFPSLYDTTEPKLVAIKCNKKRFFLGYMGSAVECSSAQPHNPTAIYACDTLVAKFQSLFKANFRTKNGYIICLSHFSMIFEGTFYLTTFPPTKIATPFRKIDPLKKDTRVLANSEGVHLTTSSIPSI